MKPINKRAIPNHPIDRDCPLYTNRWGEDSCFKNLDFGRSNLVSISHGCDPNCPHRERALDKGSLRKRYELARKRREFDHIA
jgi:hypothetical protein